MKNNKIDYLKTLTDDEVSFIKSKNAEQVKQIIGEPGREEIGIGDTSVQFPAEIAPLKNGLYKAENKRKTVYYVVVEIIAGTLVFCYSIY